MKVPAAVKHAIADFRAVGGFQLVPRKENETSYIHDWGVRVSHVSGGVSWVCLASESCRQSKDSLFVLSNGSTSKAAQHLREKHQIFSNKTLAEMQKKRTRDQEEAEVRNSVLFEQDPARCNLLLETRRIVNNNLPFVMAEYEETDSINRLTKKKEMQDSINAKQVYHAIVELYACLKAELIDQLREGHMRRFGNFVMMVDQWSCETTHRKYVGLRVFFVDSKFELKTFLLGVREFKPSFGDRDANYRACFQAWIKSIVEDFELDVNDFYAGSSDGGSDVQALLSEELKYEWEWCVAHMAHAATKAACGMDVSVRDSKNPHMTELLARVRKTISDVKFIETAGNLFEELCTTAADEDVSDNTKQLIDYTARRFLSIVRSIERIGQKWDVLEEWYNARIEQARRKGDPPPSFPLKNDKVDLIQLLSLLKPINTLKTMCQSKKPNQVSVLLTLYRVRLKTLREDAALADYRSEATITWIQADELTPLIRSTRKLLEEAFDSRFFCRYTDERAMSKCSWVLEMQQKLHPNYKHPTRSLIEVVRRCGKSAGMNAREREDQAKRVNEIISNKLRDLMIVNAGPPPATDAPDEGVDEFFPLDDIDIDFGSNDPAPIRRQRNQLEEQVDAELDKWRKDKRKLIEIVPPSDEEQQAGEATNSTEQLQQPQVNRKRERESILQFWKRMSDDGEYKILPVIARILFAIPASSMAIERDFSVCKAILTPLRASMAGTTLDMCSCLNRNRAHVYLPQCKKIAPADIDKHRPPPVIYPLPPRPAMFDEDLAAYELSGVIRFMSSTNFSLEE